MRTIGFILQKEFIQLFRNKVSVRIIIIMPMVQLLVLAYAATFEIKSTRLFIVDQDRSNSSRDLISHFSGSPFYRIIDYSNNYKAGEESVINDHSDQIINIPKDFEKNLKVFGKARVQLVTNAINSSAASLENAYSFSIIRDYNQGLLLESTGIQMEEPVQTTYSYWYNPELNYKNYMVPGILVLLLTIISMFLSGMNLVREKEIGTIEQINVTPIKKIQFIIGKLLPFWIIGLFELTFGLILAKIVFNIPILGSLWLLYLVSAVYLVVTLGIGLLVSTKTQTQQQAMFLSWFFMVIFILMSGLFTPTESMPQWAQVIDWFNPLKYMIEAVRMIMLKGSGFIDVIWQIGILALYGVTVIWVAVWQYKKVA